MWNSLTTGLWKGPYKGSPTGPRPAGRVLNWFGSTNQGGVRTSWNQPCPSSQLLGNMLYKKNKKLHECSAIAFPTVIQSENGVMIDILNSRGKTGLYIPSVYAGIDLRDFPGKSMGSYINLCNDSCDLLLFSAKGEAEEISLAHTQSFLIYFSTCLRFLPPLSELSSCSICVPLCVQVYISPSNRVYDGEHVETHTDLCIAFGLYICLLQMFILFDSLVALCPIVWPWSSQGRW